MNTLTGKEVRIHKASPWDGCDGVVLWGMETAEGWRCFVHPKGWPEGSGVLCDPLCLEVLE